MVNEKELMRKIADFFNKMNVEEISAFRRFTMSKKWASCFEQRFANKQVEL